MYNPSVDNSQFGTGIVIVTDSEIIVPIETICTGSQLWCDQVCIDCNGR